MAGTFVKVHKHGTGAPKGDAGTTPDARRAAQAVGVSRGGLTIKIVAMVDQGGQLAGFGADAREQLRTAFAARPAGRRAD